MKTGQDGKKCLIPWRFKGVGLDWKLICDRTEADSAQLSLVAFKGC